jgi:hypothetical protein
LREIASVVEKLLHAGDKHDSVVDNWARQTNLSSLSKAGSTSSKLKININARPKEIIIKW